MEKHSVYMECIVNANQVGCFASGDCAEGMKTQQPGGIGRGIAKRIRNRSAGVTYHIPARHFQRQSRTGEVAVFIKAQVRSSIWNVPVSAKCGSI